MRQRRHLCGACKVLINNDVRDITRRLLAHLDPERQALLLQQYHSGRRPKHLCASCFNATLGTLNNMLRSAA